MRTLKTLTTQMDPKEQAELKHAVQAFWDEGKKSDSISYRAEEKLLTLTEEESLKCRFVMTDEVWRNCECTVHVQGFTHGLRLHPRHLYSISKEGILFVRKDMKSGWTQWRSKNSENKERFKKIDDLT